MNQCTVLIYVSVGYSEYGLVSCIYDPNILHVFIEIFLWLKSLYRKQDKNGELFKVPVFMHYMFREH